MTKTKKQKKSRPLLWRIAALLIAVACMIAIIYLLAFSKDTGQTAKYKTVSTKYYTTQVPIHYRVQKATNPDDANMVSLLAHDGSGNEIGITTNLLPARGLAGVPDYAYRMNKPAEYTLVSRNDLPT